MTKTMAGYVHSQKKSLHWKFLEMPQEIQQRLGDVHRVIFPPRTWQRIGNFFDRHDVP